ncbi:MAG TPA: response regulator [Bacteroidota bacterium]|nr:response regulator [Bacteroidota bacterium]
MQRTPGNGTATGQGIRMDEKVRQLKISALLHGAEASIKQGEYEEALGKIRSVYTFDYKNLYAHAFEERILSLIADSKLKKKLAEDAKKAAAAAVVEVPPVEASAPMKSGVTFGISIENTPIQRVELTPEIVVPEEKPEERSETAAKPAPASPAGTAAIAIAAEEQKLEVSARASNTTEERNLEVKARMVNLAEERELEVNALAASILELNETPPAALRSELPPVSAGNALPESNEAFRLKLEEERAKWEEEKTFFVDTEKLKTKERFREAYRSMYMLTNTALSKELMETLLSSLRGILDINDTEHAEIVRSVQVNAYIDALRSAWAHGRLTEEDRESLKKLRVHHRISEEEHDIYLRQVKRKLGIPENTGGILAIDDSRDILIFIEYVLKKKFPNIRTAGSVVEAATMIRDEVPALIICDVMMPETGGFAFYDMLKRGEFGESVRNVPFIFMSVCSDEYMKKIAGNLGAQTYLTKPFSRDILEQTVKDTLAL